ncbi:MAG: prephenate dehydratase domain-containing protein [Patescibacteria group bacterium]
MKLTKTTVHYLGQPGSYSYLAAKKYFKNIKNLIGSDSFEDIFNSLNKKERDYGIIPVENSLTGSITQNYDLLMKSDSFISGEIILKIQHHLLVKEENTRLINLKYCYIHSESLKQCQNFFMANKNINPIYAKNTASAAILLNKKGLKNYCAIASSQAAQINKLKIMNINVQNDDDNYTRFAVISGRSKKKGNKASIIFSLVHEPGSLLKALKPYAEAGLNLSKIESRPIIGKPWEYMFIVDFLLSNNTGNLNTVLNKMKKNTNYLKLLGVYDSGNIYES